MRLKHLAVCASLLAMAACDGAETNPALPKAEPGLAVTAPQWKLYSTQQPAEVLDATGGWEVGSDFRSSKPGRVVGFRFYRAPGETGFNYGRLWSSSGERLKQSNPFPEGTGWVTVMLNTPVYISANTTYRVSVNTNAKQVKTYGGYSYEGPLGNGPLTSTMGYYGQPTGSRPRTASASYYFVDVIFEETVPQPDLYIGGITPTADGNMHVMVCNGGTADAAPSITRFAHWVAPLAGGDGRVQTDALRTYATIPAASCATQAFYSPVQDQHLNQVYAWSDYTGVVPESNEFNNNWPR